MVHNERLLSAHRRLPSRRFPTFWTLSLDYIADPEHQTGP